MVLGDALSKLETFVWILNHDVSRSIRADLHGTTLSHATTAYDKPTT